MKKVLSLTTIIICLIMCSINFATGFNVDNYQNASINGENDLSNKIRNAKTVSAYSIDNTIEDKDNTQYHSKGGKSTEDKIYILSEEEVIKYFGCKSNETYGYQLGKNAGTKPTIYSMTSKDNVYSNSSMNDELGNTYYWLRTPGYRNKNALTVDHENVLNTYGMYVNEELGVRPVMWVSY